MVTKAILLEEVQKIHPESKARISWGSHRLQIALADTNQKRLLLDKIQALSPKSRAKMSDNIASLESALQGAQRHVYEKELYSRASALVGSEAPEYGHQGTGALSTGEKVSMENLWTLTHLLPQLTQSNADLRHYKAKARWLDKLFLRRRQGNPTLEDNDLLELAGEFIFTLSRCYVSLPTDAEGNTIEAPQNTPS